ncbi:ATP-binding cassette domain-containing protein [Acrocarpospora catenulata]|uniref:ATP-binding cassette domain-containing protein n=1 Tax=Acrocarpospora catenulata TaxID=2836182 RepID=UPI001BD9B1EF|nr:ABC transporter ATP-binding protein [Acrocarpospora catenulata]
MRVEVRDLVLRYGETTALDGVTLSLEPNKIHGLLGRNGSGKTSLLSVLAAFRRQSAGEVRIGGEPVFENTAVTSRISLIRDEGETVDLGTVDDALFFAEWLRPDWDAKFASELLERFALTRKMSVKAMSKGQRSAFGVIIGLAGRAPLTMFDESHLGMDVPSRQAFYDVLLADYMARPRTIILSSHLIEEVSPLLEKVVIIDAGRVVVQEETQALLARGTAITGAAASVDAFTEGLTVLDSRHLGGTKSVLVYGALDEERRRRAEAAGLELGPVAMEDLFVHLTGGPR